MAIRGLRLTVLAALLPAVLVLAACAHKPYAGPSWITCGVSDHSHAEASYLVGTNHFISFNSRLANNFYAHLSGYVPEAERATFAANGLGGRGPQTLSLTLVDISDAEGLNAYRPDFLRPLVFFEIASPGASLRSDPTHITVASFDLRKVQALAGGGPLTLTLRRKSGKVVRTVELSAEWLPTALETLRAAYGRMQAKQVHPDLGCEPGAPGL